ncbi:Imidazole glycerol phosphate synthase subunit HisH 2 [Salinivirga cyanobacteriivorans]|uniref:Imidazole glycerol phosphate synthase subunit HisH n=1 Tax=Salinivirga cyanobacteriivorans TaxID=1307839 RepID=A0A0S2HZ96_9BACT|nr:imidazole glycerol phosphate synthase subunit HisH [Salinivirga cyanobacteriivorans]ALO15386.1 Imidazole glycerol phosphate synthase subunit HisH 2 [Salinivirga cyanobacteriivorans]
MKIVIIQYNAGNIQSVDFALQRLGIDAEITADPDKIRKADKVIFPGVGEASGTMKYLKENGLDKVIKSLEQPVLGICLGMQLMCTYSEEGSSTCMDILPAPVKKFSAKPGLKIPHMGWNKVEALNQGIFSVLDQKYVYFVHSYYVPQNKHTKLTSNYDGTFSAAMQYKNFYGVQFHPEKSGEVGAQFLKEFITL